MSAVVINGDTSGSVTLQAPAIAGSTTITLPSTSGTALTDASTSIVSPAMLTIGAPSWDSSGVLSFNSGYGSTAPAYGCRAWINFNANTGGPPVIRSSANVSSITDNGIGNFTINFTTALFDADYSVVATTSGPTTFTSSPREAAGNAARDLATTSFRFLVFAVDSTNTVQDPGVAGVAVFR